MACSCFLKMNHNRECIVYLLLTFKFLVYIVCAHISAKYGIMKWHHKLLDQNKIKGCQERPAQVFGNVQSFPLWIKDLVKGGPQLLRLKVADVAEWSHVSGVSYLQPGSRVHLRALEAFGFLMFKYAFSHILETLWL